MNILVYLTFTFLFYIKLIHSDNLVTISPTDIHEKQCRDIPKIKRFKLFDCCSLPEFFKPEVREKCVPECTSSDAKHDPWCCMTKCTLEETELASEGTINKTAVKRYFRKLFNSTEIKKAIEGTVNKCEHEVPDLQTENCEHPEYGALLSCIHRELFRSCSIVKAETTCLKIKNFIRKCPSRKDELFES